MAQQDEISRNDYAGNGSTTDFPYTFRILDRTHINVVLVEVKDEDIIETPQVIDVDYDVSGVNQAGGGTVTFLLDPPPTGQTIILTRELPFDQGAVFNENSPFPAKTVETAYDKLTQISQELRQIQKTALKPPNVPNFIDGTLPNEMEPLDILQINETLDGFVANSLQIVFGAGPLTAHQLIQLGNISETTTISTSQWDFLGLMDQGVATIDAVTFASVNGATNLSDLALLTSAEITQLTNIDAAIITTANWSFVSSLNQALGTTDSPEFAGITIGGEDIGTTTIHANQNFNTGSIENGNLSIASATTFNISAGSGIVVDYSTDLLDPDTTEVVWTAFGGVSLLNMASNNFKSIAIDDAAAIVQKDGQFTELELRDLIYIGIIIHDATDILDVLDIPRKSIGRHDVVTDMLTTIGILNRSGNVYSANGVNLNLDKTSGESFGLSLNSNTSDKLANITTDAADTALTFTPIHQDGSGGWTILTDTITVDVGNYDDGSGTLQSLAVNQATNHRLAFEARTGRTFFLYGQTQYATLTQATDAVPDAFIVIDVIIAPIDIRSILSSRGGATDLSLVTDAVFTEVSKLGVTSGATTSIQAASIQTAYDQDPLVVLLPGTPFELHDGTLRIEGVAGNAELLHVKGSATQGVIALSTMENNSSEPVMQNFEDQSEFKKPVNITSTVDSEVPLRVTGSTTPSTFLFQVRDNALTSLFSVDVNGDVLVNGAELGSGPNEVVLNYAEFDVFSTTTSVSWDIPAFDDVDIVSLRLEVRGLQTSELGNPPGTSTHTASIRFSTQGGVPFKNDGANYLFSTVTDGDRLNKQPGAANVVLGPSELVGTPSNIPVRTSSFDVNIPKIPEFLGDFMELNSFGSFSEQTINNFAQRSVHVSALLKSVAGEEAEVINKMRINTIIPTSDGAASGLNLVAGSIKLVGIRRGGPAF